MDDILDVESTCGLEEPTGELKEEERDIFCLGGLVSERGELRREISH